MHGLVLVHLPRRLSQRRSQPQGPSRSADDKPEERLRGLGKRAVHFGQRPVVTDVPLYSHNLPRLGVAKSGTVIRLPRGLSFGQWRRAHRLIDDDHWGSADLVPVGKIAPGP